jgi:hypothetical protein
MVAMRTVMIAALLLAGCTVGNGARMKFAGQSVSSKAVEQVAGCIAVQLSAGRATLASTDIAGGKRLTETVAVSGINFVQRIVDVTASGSETHVSVQQLQADVPEGSPVQQPLAACL